MKRLTLVLLVVALVALASPAAAAQPAPNLDVTIDGVGRVSAPLQIVLLLTLLASCRRSS